MPRGDEFNEKLYLSEHEDDEEDIGYGGGGGASYDDDDDEEGSGWGMTKTTGEELWDSTDGGLTWSPS